MGKVIVGKKREKTQESDSCVFCQFINLNNCETL